MVWLQKSLNQTGATRMKVALVMMLLVLTGALATINMQSLSAQVQADECTPSLHRLLLNGQQVSILPSQLVAFTDDTPVAVDSVQRRIDEVVTEEGFASIPLKSNQANGNKTPKLNASGTVYTRWYWWDIPEYTVWRVQNKSAQAKTVTVKSQFRVFNWWRWRWEFQDGDFSKTVVIPAYSDGFVRSDETSRWAYHQLIENNQHRARKRASANTYRDARLIESSTTIPLYQAVKEQGVVTLENATLNDGVTLFAQGRLETDVAGEYRSVWKISNGTNESQEVTLEALDSDFTQTITLPAKSDTYVLSDEDGCVDNPSPDEDALWVAESEGLLRILTSNGEVAFELAIQEPIDALSVSPTDRTIWILTNGNRLEGFDSQGVSVSDALLGLPAPVTELVVGAQTAWFTSGNDVLVIARDGTSPVQSVDFQEPVQALVYDSLRDRIWVVLPNKMVVLDGNGVQSAEIDISPDAVQVAAYDKRLDNIWLVMTNNGTEWIQRYSVTGALLATYNTNSTNNWTKASADANGGLWLSNEANIAHSSQNAELEYSLPAFSDLADTRVVDIASGAADGSLWVANQTVLRQYDIAGSLLKTLIPDLGDGVIRNLNHIDLETELPVTIPSVTITSPTDGVALKETPQLRLSVTPNGADIATIAIFDNGVEINSTCQSDNGETVCPLPTLADGLHSISLTINASDGAVSEPVTVSFSIDTIAPQIIITGPVDGSTVSQAVVAVSGSVSEPSEVTVNGQIVALNGNNEFNTNLTLLEGLNTIVVVAIDAVGNETTQAISVTHNANLPPVIESAPVLTAKAGNNYFYDVNATDPNGDELSYSLSQSPTGMTIDASSGEINWTPASQGSADVTVNVSDGRGGSDQQSFTIAVAPANLPPVITSTPILQTAVDSNYVYQLVANDPDGDDLRYRLLDAPSGLRIDADTGRVTWQPFNVTTSTVIIEVRDPGGLTAQQEYRLMVVFTDGKEPPVMNPVGDIVAPLGQTTRRTIVASDLEGEVLTYSIAPLPLPQGMTFHERTGEFEYRPVVADVGSRFYTFSVSDGRFSSSQIVSIEVPTPDGITRLRGRTLLPDDTPIQGVRFEMGGQQSISDANGDFLIEDIAGSGRLRLLVDGSGVDPSIGTFATIPEQFDIVAGAENHLFAPVYLQPLDIASADPVDPFRETKIISSDVIIDGVNYGPVIITIDPETANIPANGGELFDDLISISRIPDVDFGPAPMPDEFDLSVYIAVQPFGVNYTQPARVSFPNVESFPAGTIVDIFGLNHDTGAFEKTGEGEVSADGTRVNSIGGAVFNNSWHGFTPRPPDPNPPPDDCDCDKSGPAASTYDVKSGNFSDEHSTVPYFSLGESRNLNFVYNSKWASPKPILNFDTLAGLPPPTAMSQKLEVGGIETQEVFLQPGTIGSILNNPIGSRNSIQFDARQFVSGIYPYDFTIDCFFPSSHRAGTASGDVVIVNESNSPFGAGWTIANLRKLYISADRSKVAMDMGTGTFWMYKRNAQGTFDRPAGNYSELVENLDNSFTLVSNIGIAYQFNQLGQLVSMEDRNNNTTSYVYDGDGRLILVTDPLGFETQLGYIGAMLTSVTDPADRVTEFEHDSQGNLTKITDPDGTFRTFDYFQGENLMSAKTDKRRFESTIKYDSFGRFQSATLPDGTVRQARPQDVAGLPDLRENAGTMDDLAPTPPNADDVDSGYTDGNGNAMRFKMNEFGYLVEETDGVGRVTTIDRDENNNPIKVVRPNESIVTSTYDENGNTLTQTEEYNGATTTFTYDQFSQATSKVDALGRTTTMERDNKGNLIRQVDALGHETTMTYDSRGQISEVVDPNGLITSMSYNPQGLLSEIIETPSVGDVRTMQVVYTEFGQPRQINSADGVITTIDYDGLNRPVSTRTQIGEAIELSYDEAGNTVQVETLNVDGSIAQLESRAYDNRNRLVTTSRPNQNGQISISRQEYDKNNNISRRIDPNGEVTRYFYDGSNRAFQMIQPDGAVVSYQYNDRNQVVRVTTGNNSVTSFEYDALNRRTEEISADKGRWQWGYDLVDNVIRQTDDRGLVTNFVYDRLNRPLEKGFPDVSENVVYSYDNCVGGVGRVCERTDESGLYRFVYDEFGNVLNSFHRELGVDYQTSYQYDNGNNLSKITYPSGRVVDYQRDGLRRIQAIANNSQLIVSGIEYRGDASLTSRTWGNGIAETRIYDQQGRVEQIALSGIGDRNYGYDLSSNVVEFSSPFRESLFSFDENNRVQQEVVENLISNYSYDLNGNRLRMSVNDSGGNLSFEDYRYQDDSNKLNNRERISIDGGSAEIAQRSFDYNDANRMQNVQVNGEIRGSYFYNDVGLRTRKITLLPDGSNDVTIFHYDLKGNLIMETNEVGNVVKEYIWGKSEPVAQVDGGGVKYLHTDHLLTPRVATDDLQTVVWLWESDAFGASEPQVSTADVNLRFSGQYYDDESGLHYNWNRYYEPETGRYISSDPIGLAGGFNSFTYANSNALVYQDTTGLRITGSWNPSPRFNIVDWGVDGWNFTSPTWSGWTAIIQFIEIRGHLDGFVNIDVKCKETTDCDEREWDINQRISLTVNGSIKTGLNLWASLAGLRAGLPGWIAAQVIVGGVALLQLEHELLTKANQKAGLAIRGVMQYGPTAICNGSALF